jgi:beta-glucanase (GH16 family)
MVQATESEIREAIDKQGFVYSSQLAALAELTKPGATQETAMMAIKMQLWRGTMTADKPPEMQTWHIETKAAMKWLKEYQPHGGEHGPEQTERSIPTGDDPVEAPDSIEEQEKRPSSSVH